MKVIANEKIKGYRAKALGIGVKEFRKLREGDPVYIDKEIYEKYKHIFSPVITVKEEKDGN